MCDLAKKLKIPTNLDFIIASSYGNGLESSGEIAIKKDLDETIMGRDVIVVEDLVDSGRTLSHVMKMLAERQPASLKLCALLDKPDRRVADDFAIDYCGFTVPDIFIVGYGLDYAQRYRNLPYVGVLEFD